MRFILASASPRRKELLEQIGVKFDILPATGEEVITKELPGEEVMELAKQKAEEVAKTAGCLLYTSMFRLPIVLKRQQQMRKSMQRCGISC